MSSSGRPTSSQGRQGMGARVYCMDPPGLVGAHARHASAAGLDGAPSWRDWDPGGPVSPQRPIYAGNLERVKGIEPSYAAWEAAVLPLNYTRDGGNSTGRDPRQPFVAWPGTGAGALPRVPASTTGRDHGRRNARR